MLKISYKIILNHRYCKSCKGIIYFSCYNKNYKSWVKPKIKKFHIPLLDTPCTAGARRRWRCEIWSLNIFEKKFKKFAQIRTKIFFICQWYLNFDHFFAKSFKTGVSKPHCWEACVHPSYPPRKSRRKSGRTDGRTDGRTNERTEHPILTLPTDVKSASRNNTIIRSTGQKIDVPVFCYRIIGHPVRTYLQSEIWGVDTCSTTVRFWNTDFKTFCKKVVKV